MEVPAGTAPGAGVVDNYAVAAVKPSLEADRILVLGVAEVIGREGVADVSPLCFGTTLRSSDTLGR